MRRRHAGPVKDLFRNPVILGSVTFRFSARRNLGHVHNNLDASLLRCLSEVGRCLQNAGPDGVNKIRALSSFECGADGFEIQQIAPHNVGTLAPASSNNLTVLLPVDPVDLVTKNMVLILLRFDSCRALFWCLSYTKC